MGRHINNSLIQILNVTPSLKSSVTLYMLEQLGAIVRIKSIYRPEMLIVQIWTNSKTKYNSEKDWYPIDLPYRDSDVKDVLTFEGSFMPTSEGNYQFTYRVGLKQNPDEWQWAGAFGENGYLRVAPPSSDLDWTLGATCIKVLPHIYIGNFIAASQAPALGIDAVLNLAREFPLSFSQDPCISYKQIGLLDGAQHRIPPDILLESIFWVEEQLRIKKKKILIL